MCPLLLSPVRPAYGVPTPPARIPGGHWVALSPYPHSTSANAHARVHHPLPPPAAQRPPLGRHPCWRAAHPHPSQGDPCRPHPPWPTPLSRHVSAPLPPPGPRRRAPAPLPASRLHSRHPTCQPLPRQGEPRLHSPPITRHPSRRGGCLCIRPRRRWALRQEHANVAPLAGRPKGRRASTTAVDPAHSPCCRARHHANAPASASPRQRPSFRRPTKRTETAAQGPPPRKRPRHCHRNLHRHRHRGRYHRPPPLGRLKLAQAPRRPRPLSPSRGLLWTHPTSAVLLPPPLTTAASSSPWLSLMAAPQLHWPCAAATPNNSRRLAGRANAATRHTGRNPRVAASWYRPSKIRQRPPPAPAAIGTRPPVPASDGPPPHPLGGGYGAPRLRRPCGERHGRDGVQMGVDEPTGCVRSPRNRGRAQPINPHKQNFQVLGGQPTPMQQRRFPGKRVAILTAAGLGGSGSGRQTGGNRASRGGKGRTAWRQRRTTGCPRTPTPTGHRPTPPWSSAHPLQ